MRKVEGHHSLYKSTSGAVINTDRKIYERAKKRKAERNRIDQMESKLDRIEKLLEVLIDEQKIR